MNDATLSNRQTALINRLLRTHTKAIYNALQSQMMVAADEVRRFGVTNNAAFSAPINTSIAQAVTNLYKEAAKQGKKNYMLVKRFGAPTSFINRVLNYLNQYILNKVVAPISKTSQDVIARIIKDAISKGYGVEKTAKLLETTPITKIRARLIVRTESVRATNLAQMTAADDEVYQMTKRWIAIEDKRTRPTHSHAGVDGQTINLEEVFTNGLKFPGDPDGPASETCNCRCTMSYRVARGLDGKPIKKQISTSVS